MRHRRRKSGCVAPVWWRIVSAPKIGSQDHVSCLQGVFGAQESDDVAVAESPGYAGKRTQENVRIFVWSEEEQHQIRMPPVGSPKVDWLL